MKERTVLVESALKLPLLELTKIELNCKKRKKKRPKPRLRR